MNEIMTEAAFRKQIGKTAGHVYLLYGEEDYLKSHAVRAVREDVCPDPSFAVFNDITIDVADYTAEGFINAMSAPPMMTEGKLILLRGLDFTAMRSEEVDDFCEVLSLISEYDFNTVLIFDGAISHVDSIVNLVTGSIFTPKFCTFITANNASGAGFLLTPAASFSPTASEI